MGPGMLPPGDIMSMGMGFGMGMPAPGTLSMGFGFDGPGWQRYAARHLNDCTCFHTMLSNGRHLSEM